MEFGEPLVHGYFPSSSDTVEIFVGSVDVFGTLQTIAKPPANTDFRPAVFAIFVVVTCPGPMSKVVFAKNRRHVVSLPVRRECALTVTCKR